MSPHPDGVQEVAGRYLQNIITPLLAYPDDLHIETKSDDRGVLLALRVNQSDMGRIIGKGGATSAAIRSLLHQFGWGTKSFVSLRIDEPDGSVRQPREDRPRFQKRPTDKKQFDDWEPDGERF